MTKQSIFVVYNFNKIFKLEIKFSKNWIILKKVRFFFYLQYQTSSKFPQISLVLSVLVVDPQNPCRIYGIPHISELIHVELHGPIYLKFHDEIYSCLQRDPLIFISSYFLYTDNKQSFWCPLPNNWIGNELGKGFGRVKYL